MEHKQILIVVTCIVVATALYLAYTHYNSNSEGYVRTPLSGIGTFHRQPSTYAFRGDGLTENPHYIDDPEDRLVPLEYGGLNPYKRDITPYSAPLGRLTTVACRQDNAWGNPNTYADCSGEGSYVTNDSKARRDMVETGDMEWFRMLNNMVLPSMKPYAGDRPYEIEMVDPDYSFPPLYSGRFHYDGVPLAK